MWHVTYRKRNGATEVGRVPASSRSEALTTAAITFGVPRSNITSAVNIGPALAARRKRELSTRCRNCGGVDGCFPGCTDRD